MQYKSKDKKLPHIKFFTVVLAIAVFASCSRKSVSAHEAEKSQQEANRICIGFSIDTLALERWQRDLDIFMNRVKELGADVIVQNAGNSVEAQNKQLL